MRLGRPGLGRTHSESSRSGLLLSGLDRRGWLLSDLTIAGGLLLFAVLVRLPGFVPSVIDPDESLYILQAREWLRGGWPYVAVWDMHPVGAPGLIALAFTLWGESIAAVRLLGALAVAATGFLLFRTVILARGDRLTGLAAAMLYVAHSVLPGGVATNTEILFAPFVAAGWVLAILAARDVLEAGRAPGVARLLGMGLCFGMALWVKQVVAPEACLAFAAVVALAVLRRAIGPAGILALAVAFAVGCAAPTTATALVYAARGEFGAFYQANFVAPLRYVTAGGPDIIVSLRLILAGLLQVAWLLAAFAVAVAVAIRGGALARLRRAAHSVGHPPRSTVPSGPIVTQPVVAYPVWGLRALLPFTALVWYAGAALGIALPAKFFSHYFLAWLPPLCLGGVLGLRALVAMAAPRRPRLVLLAAVAVIASMPILNDTAARARTGFALRLPDPSRVVAATIARLLPSVADRPGETAFLVNYEPIVYFLADLPLPTRIPFWQQLTGEYGNAIGQESDAELARVLGSRPALIVLSPRLWDQVRPVAQRMVETALADGYDGPTILQDGISEVEIWRRR